MAIVALLFAADGVLEGATYYVDYDGGSDSNPGTAMGAAWKHCPGDANATGTAGSTTLSAGDTVIFKGGVAYRGAIAVTWSGSDGNPITYDGNTAGAWGTGKAIMDGTTVISTSWTRCTDSTDAGGNANFANIYWTSVPSGVTNGWNQVLMDGAVQCHTAQDPNPSDRFLWDDTTQYRAVPHTLVTSTSLTDSSYFTQSSSAYWNEAWIGVRGSGNSMIFRSITSLNTGTDTISFASFSDYTDRDALYAVFNHPTLIDQAGETAVNVANNRMYVWPPDSGDMSGHVWSIATRLNGFTGLTKNNIAIKGFFFRGYFQQAGASGDGGAAVVLINTAAPGSGAGRNNLFENNEVRFMKSIPRRSLVTLNNDTGAIVRNNVLSHSFAGGIRMSYGMLIAESNTIDRITGTGIFIQYARNSRISQNRISNLIGTHANGISVYSSSRDVEISNNSLVNINNLITYEYSTNLNFINNLVDAAGLDQRINEWGGMGGTVRWLGNTLVNNSVDRILNIGVSGSAATYYIQNNIIDGGGAYPSTNAVHTHNIYTSRHFWQESQYGWALGIGETDQTAANVFANPGTNWTLKTGSAAIDAGMNLSAYYTVDLNGTSRPKGNAYDVGAYEHGAGSGASIEKPLNLRFILGTR